MAESESRKSLPPYVSYKAFTRFINNMRDGHLPSRVDRGVLTGMSGSGQSTMINGLQSMELIDKDGKPTKRLEQLVAAAPGSAEYKAQLRRILETAYPSLFNGSVNLKTTTTNEVQEVVRQQGVSGSTVAKVIAFFLSAAKDAGVEVSKYVRTPPLSDVGVKKRSSTPRAASAVDEDEDEDEDVAEIPLGSGIDLHPALVGVLGTLPAPGQPMSLKAREAFMKAFDAVLSLVHPVKDEQE
jgi:hypothetical protein